MNDAMCYKISWHRAKQKSYEGTLLVLLTSVPVNERKWTRLQMLPK
jgi:hypothetical protein